MLVRNPNIVILTEHTVKSPLRARPSKQQRSDLGIVLPANARACARRLLSNWLDWISQSCDEETHRGEWWTSHTTVFDQPGPSSTSYNRTPPLNRRCLLQSRTHTKRPGSLPRTALHCADLFCTKFERVDPMNIKHLQRAAIVACFETVSLNFPTSIVVRQDGPTSPAPRGHHNSPAGPA